MQRDIAQRVTWVETVWPASGAKAWARAIVLMVVGTAALALAAKLKVPFYPVPMTLQTLVLPILAAAYGSRLAVATVLLYLAEGMMGLPVFTNTPPAAASPLYLLGPTGGYLIGFVLAAGLIGSLAERGADRGYVRLVLAMLAGSVIVFACGVFWLAFLAQMPGGTGLGLEKAVAVGLMPFVIGDLVKTALAAAIIRAGWSLAGGRRV